MVFISFCCFSAQIGLNRSLTAEHRKKRDNKKILTASHRDSFVKEHDLNNIHLRIIGVSILIKGKGISEYISLMDI